MEKRQIKFSPPDISQAEIDEVVDTLKSGWITTGPKTKLFEKQIAEFCHTSKAVCLNSQTAAQELTLRVLGIGPGDEVIVPAYTYTATASVVDHVGAKIVMIDSQKDNVEMDYDLLEKAITNKTKAILPVDLGGIICDYKKIFEIVEKKKNLFTPNNDIQKAFGRIIVCADTAHSFGSTQNGLKAGEIADFSSFSFHAVKNLTTGEGGAVTWRDIPGIDNEELYKKYQLLSLHGQNKDALAKTKLGAWEYDIVAPYFKCNMTDIMASIGLAQLKRYPNILARRKEIVSKYDEAMKNYNVSVLKHYTENSSSCGHLYIVRFNGKSVEYRNAFITKMAELGVATNVHYKPLPMHTAYINLGFDIKNYPNAYHMYENAMTLPLHTCLTDEDVEYVLEAFKTVYEELK
ncbi:MAG: DegT/DnrJ/EryC1/StrS family aminotransferase [Acholeplasmatales bacterium]|nr:DegT/DnrJ/EryC1/StrS family aminotransferase [Acholeplasmatales bacterium]